MSTRPVSVITERIRLPSALRPASVRIEADAARALVSDGALLVDVQRKREGEPLEGALAVSPDHIPTELDAFPRDAPVVLACH